MPRSRVLVVFSPASAVDHLLVGELRGDQLVLPSSEAEARDAAGAVWSALERATDLADRVIPEDVCGDLWPTGSA